MSWIVDEIRVRGGAVAFDEFMELALYHPDHGYYTSDVPRIGRNADFLTAPTASAWYSRIVARILRKTAATAGPLTVVDLAAGDGSFFAGVFEALGGGIGAVVGQAVAVERSAAMRRRLAENTAGRALACVEAVTEVQSTRDATVIHASELYDALPVVRVVVRDEGLRELWVVAGRKGLEWSEEPARAEVRAYFRDHGVVLESGQIAEANLSASGSHAAALEVAGDRGLMLTLDYGYESARLYDARGRSGGSLATFRRHRVGRDPFESPGEVDLTAHVNWDDLRRPARERGWTEIGLWPLAEFLIRGGLGEEVDRMGFGMQAEIDAETFAARQEIKRLLDPEGMGADLKVLVQAHGDMVDIARKVLAEPRRFNVQRSNV